MSKKIRQGTGFRAEILRSIMAERNIKNLTLAKKIGMTNNTISNWKRGVCRPRWAELSKLSQVLGVDYKTFLK
jgi:transcriptional regulator with XRE-family HTH domain